ncbi:type II CAAX prenyl endopeptidase Rce1 family protein [Aquimarina sp. 2-A2]|uniref:CPBP family glutamic-type intramembrane protease n=1 Tax=Aquimarina sp. 2-A2 TaxID=3382644 RepID=UPI00388DE896
MKTKNKFLYSTSLFKVNALTSISLKKGVLFWRDKPRWQFAVAIIVLKLLLSTVVSLLFSFLFGAKNLINPVRDEHILHQLFAAVLIAPLFETFLLVGLYEFLLYIQKNQYRKIISLFITAFFFAINHFYSVPYLLAAFIMGYFYIAVYIMANKLFTDKIVNPFFLLVIIHFCTNLLSFCVNNL